jgi:SAM-dependent methyltransferase
VPRWSRRPTRPAPLPASLYRAEVLSAFAGGEHEAFVAAGGRPLRPRLARALALADLRPGLAVVDIGCGRGEAALHCARRGACVTAVDFSPFGLALSRRTANLARPPVRLDLRPRFVAADATGLPLSDASADRVLLLDVVEHLHPWQLGAALAEVRRILRADGYVVIHTLPNRWALAAVYPVLRLWRPGLPMDGRSAYERVVHVNEQDPRRLRRALAAAGLAERVWVEEWTSRHARAGSGRRYPDALRSRGYPVLAHPMVRRLARVAMATPLGPLVGNDLFALAWHPGAASPPVGGRFQPVR